MYILETTARDKSGIGRGMEEFHADWCCRGCMEHGAYARETTSYMAWEAWNPRRTKFPVTVNLN